MDKKTVISKIKEFFSSEEEVQKFVDVKTLEGKILRVTDMVEGAEVKEITEDGEVDVENGEYNLEDDLVLVIEDGKVSEIKEVEAEEVEEEATEEVEEEMETEVVEMANVMRTDGVAIYYEGTELVEGTALYLDEAMTEPAPDGPHELEGGLMVVIEDGKLASVEEIVEEATEEVVEEMETEDTPKLTAQLKDLISQMKDLKNSFEELKTENENLKARFNKFAAEPAEEVIKEKFSFSKISKEDKLKFFSKR